MVDVEHQSKVDPSISQDVEEDSSERGYVIKDNAWKFPKVVIRLGISPPPGVLE
jgi:hypothetical protein